MSIDGYEISIKIVVQVIAGLINLTVLGLLILLWNSNPGFI
jgi:hypothetical protein